MRLVFKTKSHQNFVLVAVAYISCICTTLEMRRSSSHACLNGAAYVPERSLCAHRSSFIGLHSRLYLALYEEEQVCRIAKHELCFNYMILPLLPDQVVLCNIETNIVTSSLEEVYKFDQMLHIVMRQNSGMKIVFYTGSSGAHQLKIVFLLGCHMIMSHAWTSEDSISAFSPLGLGDLDSAAAPDGSVKSSWQALFWAKKKQWINFKETFDMGLDDHFGIQMDEYLHYARCHSQH